MADSRNNNDTDNSAPLRTDQNDPLTPSRTSRQDEPARSNRSSDLTDPQRDQDRLRPDEGTIDMPEVKDIPGQENVHVPSLGELADTTISSDDEEGAGLLDELNGGEEDEDNLVRMGTNADVTATERETLERGADYMPTRDEDQLSRASMDSTDLEGEGLNEASFGTERSGKDLDTAGLDEDDAMEDIGEEDEENNQWSLGSGDNDRNESTP